MDAHGLQDELAGIVAGLPVIRLIYLFGSRVGGEIGPLSDHDFAILLDYDWINASDRVIEMQDVCFQVERKLAQLLEPDSVDVILLNRAPIELAYAVIAQGKAVYKYDLFTLVEYEARVMGLYGDYLPVLREQRRDILQGGHDATRIQRYREALGRTERTLGEIKALATPATS
jgi:uncharacterized protein